MGELWTTHAVVSGARYAYVFAPALVSGYTITPAEMGYTASSTGQELETFHQRGQLFWGIGTISVASLNPLRSHAGREGGSAATRNER